MTWATFLGNALEKNPVTGASMGQAFFGIFLSLVVFLIGQWLFKIGKASSYSNHYSLVWF